MAEFVIVGGKAKKAKGRFGGECGRNCDRSYERRHLKLTSKQLVAAALEELRTYKPAKSQTKVSKPTSEFSKQRDRGDSAPDHATDRAATRSTPTRTLLAPPRALFHNNRRVVAYPDGMRIYSASY